MRLPTRGGATGPAAVNRYLLPNEQQVITVRRHPAVLIGPSVLTLAGLLAAGVAVVDDAAIPAISRFYAEDPFGNRLEFQGL